MAVSIAKPSPLVSYNNTIAATLVSSTSAWTDLGTWDCRFMRGKNFYFTAASTANVNIQVLGSYDDETSYPLTALASFTLNNASTDKHITDYYTGIKMQAQLTAASTTTTIAVTFCGSNFST